MTFVVLQSPNGARNRQPPANKSCKEEAGHANFKQTRRRSLAGLTVASFFVLAVTSSRFRSPPRSPHSAASCSLRVTTRIPSSHRARYQKARPASWPWGGPDSFGGAPQAFKMGALVILEWGMGAEEATHCNRHPNQVSPDEWHINRQNIVNPMMYH